MFDCRREALNVFPNILSLFDEESKVVAAALRGTIQVCDRRAIGCRSDLETAMLML